MRAGVFLCFFAGGCLCCFGGALLKGGAGGAGRALVEGGGGADIVISGNDLARVGTWPLLKTETDGAPFEDDAGADGAELAVDCAGGV